LNWYSVSTGAFNGTVIKTSTQDLKEIDISSLSNHKKNKEVAKKELSHVTQNNISKCRGRAGVRFFKQANKY
jgi:hypothetical protein